MLLLAFASSALAADVVRPRTPPAPGISPVEALTKADHEFPQVVLPVVQENCDAGHGNGKHKGDLKLDDFRRVDTFRDGAKVWGDVLERLRDGELQPADADQPVPRKKPRTSR